MAASIKDHLNVSREKQKDYSSEGAGEGCERAFSRRKNSANQYDQ